MGMFDSGSFDIPANGWWESNSDPFEQWTKGGVDSNLGYNTLSEFNLASIYNQAAPGFTGSMYDYADEPSVTGYDAQKSPTGLSSEYKEYLKNNGYSYRMYEPHGYNGYLSGLFKDNNLLGYKSMTYDDPLFGMLIDAGTAAVTGGAFGGGGIAGSLGINPGALGSAVNGAAAGGVVAAGNDQDILKGIATGGFSGGAAGLNPAGMIGVKNPIASHALNSAVGAGVGSAINGGPVTKSAVMGGLTGGLNGMGKAMGTGLSEWMDNIFTDKASDGPGTAPQLNASYPANWVPGGTALYNNITQSPVPVGPPEFPAMSYVPPSSPAYSPTGAGPSTYSAATMPSIGTKVGNYVKNNMGTLARMLYGTYTMNKQRGQINDVMSGLRGLYDPNGAYAKQLRQKLIASDAKNGRRSNISGRETQLMSNLAEHNAQLAPTLLQMQQGLNNLGANQMNMFFKGMDDMDGWAGLGSLFGG